MKNKIYTLLIVLFFGFMISCDDFLDETPDNRTELDSGEKVRKLLVSAYPVASYAYITEMMSDNSDESEGIGWESEILQEQAYGWKDITSIDDDSPQIIWEQFYKAIASANTALEAIREMGDPAELSAQKGEAMLCRAYGHFVLVNLFSKQYGPSSASDMGIPYITEPETTVQPQYDRGTVAGVYELIEQDIEDGLPLINNTTYDVPKYHFNKTAAYAFATRFYLYYQKYDKVIEYTNLVLGSNPLSVLRDWESLGMLTANGNVQPDAYINKDNPATLLLMPANSYWAYIHGPYTLGRRYGHNQYLSSTETVRAMTPWGNMTDIFRQGTFWNAQVNRIVVRKLGTYVEYTDQAAGIGYAHIVHPVFTTDEILLCRAEAYIMQKSYDKALEDINLFMTNFTYGSTVTSGDISNYYGGMEYYTPEAPTQKKRLNPAFTIDPGTQENYVHCILNLRRLLTLHEGLRWFDIRRYGIEINRRIIGSRITVTDTMSKDDLRRTIQIPQDVIDAGLPANPR
ncbi:MAG: RagB/SusD family nutrient uptake outer membrane protein [Prevotella sp.]|jgi:hypothetical protein|nr:RagB/SusD family nutrient uptake outer membrane protein [Prevotella sp.]